MKNLPAALSTLQTEISALTDKLAPSAEADVAKAIKSLLAAGFAVRDTIDPEMAVAVYTFALEEISGNAVKRVVAKIIRGEYEIHRAFIPSPPEFAIFARAEDAVVVDALARAKSILEAKSRKVPDGYRSSQAPLLNDVRITQRVRAENLEQEGYRFVATCESLETFVSMGKKRQVPIGSIHLWAIDEVWAPRAKASEDAPPVYQEQSDAA